MHGAGGGGGRALGPHMRACVQPNGVQFCPVNCYSRILRAFYNSNYPKRMLARTCLFALVRARGLPVPRPRPTLQPGPRRMAHGRVCASSRVFTVKRARARSRSFAVYARANTRARARVRSGY